MLALTRLHEGIGKSPNSHWGDADRVFKAFDFQKLAEQYVDMVVPNQPGPDGHGRLYVAWYLLQREPLTISGPLLDEARVRDNPNGDYAAIANVCLPVR